MDPYLVTMMLVCTTLGYSLPFGMDSDQHSSCSESVSEALSRGSSAILEVTDARATVLSPIWPASMLCFRQGAGAVSLKEAA